MNPQYMMPTPHQPGPGYGGPPPGGPYQPMPGMQMQRQPDGPGSGPYSHPPPGPHNGPAPMTMIPQVPMKPAGPMTYGGPPQLPASVNGGPPMKSGPLPPQSQMQGGPRPPMGSNAYMSGPPASYPGSGPPPRPPPSSTPGQMTAQMGRMQLDGPPRPPMQTMGSGMGLAGPNMGQPMAKLNSMPPPTSMCPPTSMQPPTSMPPPTNYGPTSGSLSNVYPSPVNTAPPGQPMAPSSGMYDGSVGAPPPQLSPQSQYNMQNTIPGTQYNQWSPNAVTPPGSFQPQMMHPPQDNTGTMHPPPGVVNGVQSYINADPSAGPGLPPGVMKSRYPPAPAPGQGMMSPPSPSGTNQVPGRMGPMNTMQQPMAPQQPRRLDPDQMPSPIQVIEDDKKNRGGVFATNTKGQIPPLVTTEFITEDQGVCNPRFMRSTMYSIPANPDMLKQTGVPLAVVISPFARLHPQEYPPRIVNMGELGPVRCVRCKAYMCPFMQFMDGGRRFQCGFCKGMTEVPPEYFAHLDHTGQRVDKFERPELCLGSYEFVATKEYCRSNNFPQPPAFVFLIDVSYSSVKNGMVNLLCQNIKQLLALLPKEGDSRVRVGFITFSNTIHFYNLKGCLAQPQMMVVSDLHDMFMPLLDGFLVDVDESEAVIDSLLEQIPQMFGDSRETETVLGPAIQAGLEALKASDCSGKLLVFHAALPIADAPGKLKNRDDRKLLGTDKEKVILMPQNNFYNQLGQECVAAGCSVDLFTFPIAYIDIATIGQVSRLSGGQIHKYTYFQADIDGQRFLEDLKRTIQRPIAFDAIMRVRTSTGVRPTDFYGSYYMSNTTDVELAATDSDKAITVEIKHDDKLADEDTVFIQAAILFTSIGGQRRLRIHNLSLNTCTQMADLYRNCELDTIMNYLAKSSLRQLMEQNPKSVKEHVTTRCAQILASYRKNCASPSLAGQLILPECMKLLPLYANCLLKSDAIAGGSDMLTDDRSFAMMAMSSMDVGSSLAYIYPRLLPLHDVLVDETDLPVALRCSIEKLQDAGVYLLENGIYMFLWIGMNVASEWVQNVFSVQSAAQIDIDKTKLLDLDNPLSQRVRDIISKVQDERQRFMRLVIVRQRDKLDLVFKHFLVEDKGSDNSPSYVDYLCHLHKEIRSLLS